MLNPHCLLCLVFSVVFFEWIVYFILSQYWYLLCFLYFHGFDLFAVWPHAFWQNWNVMTYNNQDNWKHFFVPWCSDLWSEQAHKSCQGFDKYHQCIALRQFGDKSRRPSAIVFQAASVEGEGSPGGGTNTSHQTSSLTPHSSSSSSFFKPGFLLPPNHHMLFPPPLIHHRGGPGR